MRKRLIATAVAGSVGLVGLGAVAIPALADTPTPSASSSGPGSKGQSFVDRIRERLQGLVDDKTITDDQADKVAKSLGEGRGGFGGPGFGGPGRGGPGAFGLQSEGLDAVAKVLGISADDVRTALSGGSTIADLAKKHNKSVDDVVKALVDDAKARIAQAVKDGKLTQDQADGFTSNLEQRIREVVENGRPAFRGGPGTRPWRGGGAGPSPSSPASPSPSSPSPSASSSTSTEGTAYSA